MRYQARYWRWASYVLGLSAVISVIGLVLLLTLDVRTYIARSSVHGFPGLSADLSLLVLWAMVVFCGFVWPWLLIGLHQPFLRRLTTRLITEVDAQPSIASG